MQMKFHKNPGFRIKWSLSICLFFATLSLIPVVHANPKIKKDQISAIVLKAQVLMDDYKGQGDNLYKAGELLTQAMQLDSSYAPIFVQAARLTLSGGHIVSYEFRGGTLDKSEALLRRAISLDPKESDAYMLLGHVCRLMRRHDEAFVYLTKATELNSQNPWLLNNFGAYYFDLRQIDKASAYYSKAVEKGKGKTSQQRNSYIDALVQLQWFSAVNNDNESVLRYGKMATGAASPTDAWTWGNVGNILFIQGFFEEAERHARKALKIMNYGVGRRVLALSLYGKWAKAVAEGHPEQGEPFFSEAYRIEPNLNHVISRFNRSAKFMKSYVPIVKKRQDKLRAVKSGSYTDR